MEKYTTYVGLDVHARSIKASAVDVETGEVFCHSFGNCPTESDVAKWLAGLPQPVYCAYESGCTGFHLARGLRKLGFACDVIAVSTLARSSKDKKHKCDKLDARAIRREIANPDSQYSVVWIPDEKTEAERDLVRCYRVAIDGAKHAKQRLIMFLQRHGYVWCEKTKAGRPAKAWTRRFEEWLDSISFSEPCADETFAAYRRQVRDACQEVKRLKELVGKLAASPEHAPYVEALCALKGMQVENAILACVEIGDFARFKSGRKISCWLGTVPSDDSSGESEKHGHITKDGDKYLRRALIEGYSGIATWTSGKKALPKGSSAPAAIQAIAAKANDRLYQRYRHLSAERHKNPNAAKVAVVNELIRWIWVLGLSVQAQQAQIACA